MIETVVKPLTGGVIVQAANKRVRLLAGNTRQALAGTIGAGTVKTVQTRDGRCLVSDGEEYRQYCEARFALTLPDKSDGRKKGWKGISKREYLARVKTKRGQVAHDALREEMKRQWKLSYPTQLT